MRVQAVFIDNNRGRGQADKIQAAQRPREDAAEQLRKRHMIKILDLILDLSGSTPGAATNVIF